MNQLDLQISGSIPQKLNINNLKHSLNELFLKYRPTNIKNGKCELIFVHNQEMQQLNHKYRGKDQSTDVLSFPIAIDSKKGLVVPISQEPLHLGSIIISVEYIQQHYPKQDLIQITKQLALHGLRHLLGHDHDEQGNWL